MLPMQRHTALIEKTGARENVRTAGDAADGDAAAGELAEPGKHGLVVEGGGVAAGADEQHVDIAVGACADIGEDGKAVRGHHRLAARCRVPPAIERLARDEVRRAQGLDGRGIGHQRKAGYEQEAHRLRPRLRLFSGHVANCQAGVAKCQ